MYKNKEDLLVRRKGVRDEGENKRNFTSFLIRVQLKFCSSGCVCIFSVLLSAIILVCYLQKFFSDSTELNCSSVLILLTLHFLLYLNLYSIQHLK
jgi:hypothetical protein